jgi:archaellum component FlaC
MSLWDAANEIEELAYKLGNVRDLVELVAEDVQDPYSGALWAIKDMIDDLQKKVFDQADKVMDLHRAETKPKKAKK